MLTLTRSHSPSRSAVARPAINRQSQTHACPPSACCLPSCLPACLPACLLADCGTEHPGGLPGCFIAAHTGRVYCRSYGRVHCRSLSDRPLTTSLAQSHTLLGARPAPACVVHAGGGCGEAVQRCGGGGHVAGHRHPACPLGHQQQDQQGDRQGQGRAQGIGQGQGRAGLGRVVGGRGRAGSRQGRAGGAGQSWEGSAWRTCGVPGLLPPSLLPTLLSPTPLRPSSAPPACALHGYSQKPQNLPPTTTTTLSPPHTHPPGQAHP